MLPALGLQESRSNLPAVAQAVTEDARQTVREWGVLLGERLVKVSLLLMFLEASRWSACLVSSWSLFAADFVSVVIASLARVGGPCLLCLCFGHLVQYPVVGVLQTRS